MVLPNTDALMGGTEVEVGRYESRYVAVEQKGVLTSAGSGRLFAFDVSAYWEREVVFTPRDQSKGVLQRESASQQFRVSGWLAIEP